MLDTPRTTTSSSSGSGSGSGRSCYSPLLTTHSLVLLTTSHNYTQEMSDHYMAPLNQVALACLQETLCTSAPLHLYTPPLQSTSAPPHCTSEVYLCTTPLHSLHLCTPALHPCAAQEIQHECFLMGIPLRTRHREVAPNQYAGPAPRHKARTQGQHHPALNTQHIASTQGQHHLAPDTTPVRTVQ